MKSQIEMMNGVGQLEMVQRRELAELLVIGAGRLGLGQTSLGRRAFYGLIRPVGQSLRHWTLRARRHLELLAGCAWAREGVVLLEDLVAGHASDCTAVEVISLGIEIWPAPNNYLALGQALLTSGRPDDAKAAFTFLMYEYGQLPEVDGDLGWRLREGLAAAWECLGKDRVASGCLEVCVADPRSGAAPLVSALFLAVELGRGESVIRYAGEVNQRFAMGSRRLGQCIDGVVARNALLRPGVWVPPEASVGVFGDLVRGGGSSGLFCRRLIDGDGGQA